MTTDNPRACDTYTPPTGKPENSGYCDHCGMHDWKHTAATAAGTCGPECDEGHTYAGRCESATTADTTNQCRAEHHAANMPSGHCELPEGHDGMHRDESVPPSPLNWAETVATYPTDAPAED